ncbi:chorismate mutase [Wukongibacter baidiensis]|uniref:chorismate mutase n=1 Tax=Wukongibacter baidiensis TaxID=1723361 RepID=UPI003D7F1C9F
MNELDRLRVDIDKIDRELVALFEKRMETVIKIGEYKRKNNIPIFNQAREIEVLNKNVSRLKNREFENETREFLNKAMEISREVQRKYIMNMAVDGYLGHKNISKNYHSCGLDHELRVGYQGEPGAFSKEALTEYFGDGAKTVNVKEFEDVFKALKNDEIDYGVLPIENSSTGGIAEVYDLLKKYGFYIVGERCIKVQHNLVALKDAETDDIDEVYSHPQAFKQCSEFFKDYPDLRLIPYKNTATSAKYINEEKSKNKAAVCSHKAAELYDLKIIKENINYNTKNYTRFIMIGKDLEVQEVSNKISIVTTTAHTPGSLYRTLGYFMENNLNMMKIESRPILDRSWEYFFYIDFSGNLNDDAVKRSIEAIRKNSTYFKLLGNYVGHRI